MIYITIGFALLLKNDYSDVRLYLSGNVALYPQDSAAIRGYLATI